MTSQSADSSDNDIALEQIVFSCAICQATPSEVYATTESNQGFHSGSGGGGENGIVTKMWIAECSHITCAKHLQGGAAPFHPVDKQPRAPCPKCQREKGDNEPKDLYSIRGLGDGEYDPAIPSEWRQCPAIKLDTAVPGMSAVRFQYMSLGHFARQARKHWKTAESKRLQSERTCTDEHKRCNDLRKEVRDLQEQVQYLKKVETEYRKWEARKPEIRHYLGAVSKMSNDIESMRHQLLSFGVHVPERKYTFELGPSAERPKERSDEVNRDRLQDSRQDPASSRKRKRDNHPPRDPDLPSIQRTPLRRSSREVMPPPPPRSSPFKRMHDPTGFQNMQVNARQHHSDPSTQIHRENGWQYASDPTMLSPAPFGYPVSRSAYLNNQAHRSYDPPPTATNQYRVSSTSRTNDDQGAVSQNSNRHPLYASQKDSVFPMPPSTPGAVPEQPPFYKVPYPVATQSPQRNQRLDDSPGISPFFRREDFSSRPSTYQRPPTRDSFIQRQQGAPVYRGATVFDSHAPRSGKNQFSGDYADQRQLESRQPPVHASSMPQTSQQPYFRPGSMTPQTPWNSEGLLRRPDPFPPSSVYSTTRPQLSVYHGPLTQLPNRGGSRMYESTAARSQQYLPPATARSGRADEALSQIPGVKGVRRPPTSFAYQNSGSDYGAVRGTFSSVGSRQNVRR